MTEFIVRRCKRIRSSGNKIVQGRQLEMSMRQPKSLRGHFDRQQRPQNVPPTQMSDRLQRMNDHHHSMQLSARCEIQYMQLGLFDIGMREGIISLADSAVSHKTLAGLFSCHL